MRTMDLGKAARALSRNKYVLAVLLLGLVLLLLPRASPQHTASETQRTVSEPAGVGDDLDASGIPMDTESERLAAMLREIRGVGETEVLLSRAGAVVVCAGGDSPTVRLEVTIAVSAYTGLGSDKITVMTKR